MKIKTFDIFINELISFDKKGEDTVTDLPKHGEEYAIWHNGKIIVNPSNQDRLEIGGFGGSSINMQVNHDKKNIRITPFDDWSDTKIALKVQKALKDMIKAKYIDEKWTCVIMQDKLTKRSLGSKKVKDIIKQDFSYVDVIPFAYHGTSDYFYDKIKSKGLQPRDQSGEEEIWDKGYTNRSEENIYLTTDYNRARYYADYAVDSLEERYDIKSKPMIVLLQDFPTTNVIMDDDLITNMGMLQLLALMNSGKTREQFAQEASYITGIRQSSQFAVKGRIPASMITKIYKGKDL